MAQLRNWPATLWAASYKGFPFFFESNELEGGPDIIVHEFPNSDQNFNEDMGLSARYYSGTAYLTGDNADVQAVAFVGVLESHGAGLLVLPTDGPVLVRAIKPFKRTFEKDRMGRIGFDVKFVREGAASPLISVPFLAQQAVTAAQALTTAIVLVSPQLFTIANQPEYVAAAAADEVQAGIAMVDVVRTTSPVSVTVSQTVASQDQAIAQAAPLLLDPAGPNTSDVAALAASMGITALSTTSATVPVNAGFQALASALAASVGTASPSTTLATMPVKAGIQALAYAIVSTVGTLAAGMAPAVARDAMASIVDVYGPPTAAAKASIAAALSANAANAAQNVLGAQQLVRLAALTAWATSLLNVSYTDRPSGVTARAEAAERFEIELNNCPGAAFAGLYLAIEALQGSVVQFLTQLIANLAPIVTVEARASLPSLVWAWRLYQDPTRAVDLTLRNGVRHPSFLPREFQALSPGYTVSGLPTVWPAPPL
jgi:prophage DNA circulation protein